MSVHDSEREGRATRRKVATWKGKVATWKGYHVSLMCDPTAQRCVPFEHQRLVQWNPP